MTLWFILAMMTALALAAVTLPLVYRRSRGHAAAASDVAVYRDQLEEIERDRADGRIGHAEFEAARVEVSRRLLSAVHNAPQPDAPRHDDAPQEAAKGAPRAAPPRPRRRLALACAALAVPVVAIPFYAVVGSPNLPGAPLAGRDPSNSLAAAIAKIERHLEDNPGDGRGWEVLAPVYFKLNRYDDAAQAQRNVLRLLGDTAQREADLGVALAMAAGGVVTAEAKGAFDRAAAIEPGNVQAMFFLGVAAQQDGEVAEAAAIWRDVIARAPADAPLLPVVRRRLAAITAEAGVDAGGDGAAATAAPPGPSPADTAAAAAMSPEARAEFIRTMVGRLASRLHDDGSDVDGWLRLLRAYMVMGERDKARTAAGEAREALAREPEKLKLFDAGLRTLGVDEHQEGR